VDYEWDEEKAARNLEKHGISLVDAATVFDDPLYIDFYDPDHSFDEQCYLVIGISRAGHLVIVSYTRGMSFA